MPAIPPRGPSRRRDLGCSRFRCSCAPFWWLPSRLFRQSFLIASQLATISVAAVFYGIWSAKKYATDIYKIAKLSLALFAGASLSNLLERIQDGRVTDFIVVLPKLWPYIFNIADIGGLFSYLIGGYTILMAYRQDNEWVKSANRQ